jgi:geranylgeranyl reductase family protein
MPVDDRCDVLIVGGGPAGSSLAWALQNSGLDVLIMDKQDFPRQKVCAGWVTPAVMQELDVDLDDYARRRVLQPIHGFSIGQIGQKQVGSRYPGAPVSYGIRRFEFDDYLLHRCGARLRLGEPFEQMHKTDTGWCINNCIDAALVVGAGGHFCPVARAIGAKGVSELAVAAKEIEFEMTEAQKAACPVRPEIPELYFTPDLMGYGWVFRKGDYLNIGLGREDRHRLGDHVQSFCEYLKQQGRIPADTPDKFNGHAYLLYPHALREIVDDRVLLIGDAAGLAYPQSGEGIRPAVESGLLAARVIRDCDGSYGSERLAAYRELIELRFGSRQPEPYMMERLPPGLKKLIASRLMKTRWFTRKIVADRWFLQSNLQPLNRVV